MRNSVRFMNIFGLFLTISAVNVTANAVLSEGVSGQKVVSHLPGVLPQKRTPWCFAFAARSIFSQAICAKTGQCFTAEQLAVTGFVGGYHKAIRQWAKSSGIDFGSAALDSWWTGGDSGMALQYLSDTHASIASRECTNEEKLYQAGDLTPFSLSFFLSSVVEKFNGERANTHEKAVQYFARVVTDSKILPLVDWMAPAMDASNDFESFSKQLLLPPVCEGRAALGQTPAFKVKMVKFKELSAIEKQIETVLDQDSMVGLNICAGTLDTGLGQCGYHATAVAGYRTYCQNGSCEKEYLFYDSSFFLGKRGRNPDGSYWAPASLIAQASLDYLNDVSSSNGQSKILNDLKNAFTQVVARRTKILQDYQIQREEITKSLAAKFNLIIAELNANPSLDAKKKKVIENQIRTQAADGMAKLKQQFPAAPDMNGLDEVIKRLEIMVQNFGSMPLFNFNNLYWIEFPR